MKKFSSCELFELRNTIPIESLIREELPIPFKISEGVFRFLCPIQTSVNPKNNLARCFRCERNFNAIDLVIEYQGFGFKESVVFLKQLLDKYSSQKENNKPINNDIVSMGHWLPGGI